MGPKKWSENMLPMKTLSYYRKLKEKPTEVKWYKNSQYFYFIHYILLIKNEIATLKTGKDFTAPIKLEFYPKFTVKVKLVFYRFI